MPFGLLGGRGRTCPARLWMVYGRLWMVCGRLWEGRGPGMPGPYRAAIFAVGGVLNARLELSRCLLGYWAVGAGHVRPGCGWCTGGYGWCTGGYGWCAGGYGKAAGRACPAPTGRLRGCGRYWEGPSKPLRPCFARPAPLKGAPFCAGFARGKASPFRADSPDTGEVARSARRGAVAKR